MVAATASSRSGTANGFTPWHAAQNASSLIREAVTTIFRKNTILIETSKRLSSKACGHKSNEWLRHRYLLDGELEFATEETSHQFELRRLPSLQTFRRGRFSRDGTQSGPILSCQQEMFLSAPAPLIVALDPDSFRQSVDRLAEILLDCVSEGASVGFVLPFTLEEARAYWRDKVAPPLAAGSRLVLAASVDGEVIGTAQLDFDGMPSKRHHAEVSKVLVDPRYRRRGAARALMAQIERRATAAGRWLLTLDTAGDAAEALYRSLGYTLAGTIPSYARDAFEADRYDATRIMYKDLRGV